MEPMLCVEPMDFPIQMNVSCGVLELAFNARGHVLASIRGQDPSTSAGKSVPKRTFVTFLDDARSITSGLRCAVQMTRPTPMTVSESVPESKILTVIMNALATSEEKLEMTNKYLTMHADRPPAVARLQG